MDFLPWQSQPLNTLLSQLGSGKLPHAILITGAEGIGKLNFALAFAQRLFCKQAMGSSPCQQCDACHMFNVETHPDLKRIGVLDDKQAILVDQIRELIEYVSLTPHSAPKKIAIIDQVEKLNVNAANSLLKTLEEPPESSMLILVTHRPDRLLPTIRSRCQNMLFATPDTAVSENWLKSKLSDISDVSALLALAGGAPLKAVQFAEENVLEKRNKLFSEIEQLSAGKKNPLEIAKGWYKNDLELAVNCLSSWMTDMIRLKALEKSQVDSTTNLNNPDLIQPLSHLVKRSVLTDMMDYYKKLTTVNQLKQSNINPQLILEDMLIEWKNISHQGN